MKRAIIKVPYKSVMNEQLKEFEKVMTAPDMVQEDERLYEKFENILKFISDHKLSKIQLGEIDNNHSICLKDRLSVCAFNLLDDPEKIDEMMEKWKETDNLVIREFLATLQVIKMNKELVQTK